MLKVYVEASDEAILGLSQYLIEGDKRYLTPAVGLLNNDFMHFMQVNVWQLGFTCIAFLSKE